MGQDIILFIGREEENNNLSDNYSILIGTNYFSASYGEQGKQLDYKTFLIQTASKFAEEAARLCEGVSTIRAGNGKILTPGNHPPIKTVGKLEEQLVTEFLTEFSSKFKKAYTKTSGLVVPANPQS